MANPYPWATEKTFRNVINMRRLGRNISMPLAIISGLLLSPLALIVLVWSLIDYRRVNDSYRSRGAVMMAVGLIGTVLFFMFQINPVEGLMDFLTSLGNKPDKPSFGSSLFKYLFSGLPIALFFSGLAAYFSNGYFELVSKRYLVHTRPTFMQKRRIKKTQEKFAADELDQDVFELGAVKTDIMPWRQNRRGMVVGTTFDKLKHGYLVGANGTGKTIAAMNIAAEYSDAGWSVVFPDFKGDRKTENMLAAIARERGVPFYSFWSNGTDTGFRYDPLIGVRDISPASLIITAFDFTTEGPAKYYTDQAEKYLSIQFAVLGTFDEKGENESTFDWLLKTVNVDKLKTILKKGMGSRDKEKAAEAKRLMDDLVAIKPGDLSGLEANLSKMVNTMGEKMRPTAHMIDFRRAAEERAIVYFGLPSSGDKIVMRALGALVIRDLVAMASERQNVVGADIGNPVLVMPDEASQLQEKADVMLELLQQGRSAGMMVFPAMQTFGPFSEKFIRELLGNSPTAVILRTGDPLTARRISESMGEMYVRGERRDVHSETDAFGSERQQASGTGAGTIDRGPRIPVDEITNLDNRTALVFFPESSGKATLGKVRSWRVKNDENPRDIPTTYLFSRDYILAAENDVDVTREMLRRTLVGFDDGSLDVIDDVGVMDTVDLVDEPSVLAEDEVFVFDPEPVVETVVVPDSEPFAVVVDKGDAGERDEEAERVVLVEEDFAPVDESDFVDDDSSEWGEQGQNADDSVETPESSVQDYQGASLKPEKSEGGSTKATVEPVAESQDDSSDDDGLW